MEQSRVTSYRGVQGAVHSVETFGTVDGPGIRYVVFLQGCSLRCLYCHNPDTLTKKGGTLWRAEDLVKEILRYRTFIQSGGVTFSGGEPLCQPEFVEACTKLLHEEGLHVAVDTSGIEPIQSTAVRSAVDAADLLLLDIKGADTTVARALTGQGNGNAFAMLDYCQQTNKPVWIRHVLLRNYTLEERQLRLLNEKLQPYTCIRKLELLPFHKMGETKWEAMGRSYLLTDIPATTTKEVEWAAAFFSQAAFPVEYSK